MAAPLATRGGRLSWWARLRADLGLRVEHRGWVLWYLIIERGLRGVLVAGLGVWALWNRRLNVADAVADIQAQINLAGGAWWQKLGTSTLHSLVQLTPGKLAVIGVLALLYGALELTESIGLLLRRRWAEYLVVIATGFGIPIELLELSRHVTAIKLGVTAVNVGVLVYLVWRKRIFQFDESPANA